MKAINSNIWKRILFLALGFTALASCSEDAMDRVNEDNDHTTSAPAKFVLADVITSTAFSNIGGDLNTYFSVYTEHTVGVDNQLYNAEIRNGEPSVSSTFNNVWGNLYSTLKNARIVILTASDEVAANYTTRGIAEVLTAINSALITDAFGDTPYSQAALPQLKDGKPQYMAPNVDTQEAIYQAIMKSLDDAIVDLPKGDAKDKVGSYDFIYKGDGAKWIKLAYGLKARYTMRLLARSKNREADLQKVLEYVDKSFKSIDDQAAYAIYDANNLNPLFGFQWSRDGLAASKSYSDKLIERNDGRKFVTTLQVNVEQRGVEFVPGTGRSPRTAQTQEAKGDTSKSQAQGGENAAQTKKEQRRNTWTNADGSIRPISKWSGVDFTEQQKADYVAGKAVKLENVTDKQGFHATMYIKFNPEKGRPYRYDTNPDNAQKVAPSNESRTQVAVNSEGKTNEATKNLKEPLRKGQTAPKDTAQQQQQKRNNKGMKM